MSFYQLYIIEFELTSFKPKNLAKQRRADTKISPNFHTRTSQILHFLLDCQKTSHTLLSFSVISISLFWRDIWPFSAVVVTSLNTIKINLTGCERDLVIIT